LFNEKQNGFRRGWPCMDTIFTIQKPTERHLFFIDYVQGFDSVVQERLWEIMAEKGFPTHLTKASQSKYQNTTIIIRKEGVNDYISK
jgi:hypothetical protein